MSKLNSLTPRNLLLLCLLLVAGFLGYCFSLPFCFMTGSFWFGSIAIWIILDLYGVSCAVLAAAAVSSYTYISWGHPYGVVILTLEPLVVGVLLRSGRNSLVMLDGLFWLFVAGPIILLSYFFAMSLDLSQTTFVFLKQATNGIFNALIATLIVNHLPVGSLAGRTVRLRSQSLRSTTFTLLVAMVIIPSMLVVILSSREETRKLKSDILKNFEVISSDMSNHVSLWYEQRLRGIAALASSAAQSGIVPSDRLRHDTELTREIFPDFHTVVVADADGTAIASSPPVYEEGGPAIGANFAGTAYYRELLATKKPVLSEVFTGEGGVFNSVVVLAVPILDEEKFLGFAVGSLDLEVIRRKLMPQRSDEGLVLTLADSKGALIAGTPRSRQAAEHSEPR
ncbi:MAG: cache domain-containing protein [Syntrophobacteraceae bacterium]